MRYMPARPMPAARHDARRPRRVRAPRPARSAGSPRATTCCSVPATTPRSSRSPDGRALVCTDVLVDGRHFRRDWAGAADIGHRAAAQSLSDVNAMGGRATAVTVGLAAPRRPRGGLGARAGRRPRRGVRARSGRPWSAATSPAATC